MDKPKSSHPLAALAASLVFTISLALPQVARGLTLVYETGPLAGQPFTSGQISIKFTGFTTGSVYPFSVTPVAGSGAGANAGGSVTTGIADLDALEIQATSGPSSVQTVINAVAQGVPSTSPEDGWSIGRVTEILDAVTGETIWSQGGKGAQITALAAGMKDFYYQFDPLTNKATICGVGLRIDFYEVSTAGFPNADTFSSTAGPAGGHGGDDLSNGSNYPGVTTSAPILSLRSVAGFISADGTLGGLKSEFQTNLNLSGSGGNGNLGLAFMEVIGGTEAALFDRDGIQSGIQPGQFTDVQIEFTLTTFGANPDGTLKTNLAGWLAAQNDPATAFIRAGDTKICVEKYYDANANGQADPGETLITGWKVSVSDGNAVIGYTPFCVEVQPTNPQTNNPLYTVSEFTPIQSNWVATTGKTVADIDVAPGECVTVMFGNLCLGGGGGHTPGFWSNKNGQAKMNDGGTMVPELSLLSSLNLRDASGAHFNPATYASFRIWLLASEATNMAFKLSSHVAAMSLNVEAGFVGGGALVHAPQLLPFTPAGLNALGFISIGDLLTAANTELGLHGSTPAGNAFRAYQEALKDALDQANNNVNFVQPNPCPFTFAP